MDSGMSSPQGIAEIEPAAETAAETEAKPTRPPLAEIVGLGPGQSQLLGSMHTVQDMANAYLDAFEGASGIARCVKKLHDDNVADNPAVSLKALQLVDKSIHRSMEHSDDMNDRLSNREVELKRLGTVEKVMKEFPELVQAMAAQHAPTIDPARREFSPQ